MTAETAAPLLQAEGLCVTYRPPTPLAERLRGRRRLVEAVLEASFTLAAGRSLAIVGESGSGKSTLGRALVGLQPLSGGRLLFQGRPPFAPENGGRRGFHRAVAMMFQDPISSLSPRRTVRAQLAEPFAIHGAALGGAGVGGAGVGEGGRDGSRAVERLLGLVGLPSEIAGRYPHQLSGGQARRVGVARALALSPRLIVADEPTAGLDVSVQAEVLNLLGALRQQFGLAYVIITHNMALVRHVSDAIAVFYMGRVVESGPTAAVLTAPAHPYTRALIEAQPHPDPERRRSEAPLLGETPSLLARPPGCEFRGRCPLAHARCAEAPPLRSLAPGRSSRCWLDG